MINYSLKLFGLLTLLVTIINVNTSVIGIDLGTEFIKIAIYKEGRPFEMVENLQSKTKTPFAVAFKDDERVFGAEAVVKKSKIPEQVFTKMHDFLGKQFNNPEVKNYLREYFVSYKIEEDSERKVYSFAINYGTKNEKHVLTIEEIYGMIFRYIQFLSDKYSQSEVKDCVVTVPSFFGYRERLAIIQAVEISGLKLLHLVTENTGAAVSYAMNNKFLKEYTYFILYNMGTSFTQTTLVSFKSRYDYHPLDKNKTVEHQQVRIIDETWDSNLGGRNFDFKIVKHLIKVFYEKNQKTEHLQYLQENTQNSNSNSNSNDNDKESIINSINKIAEKIHPNAVKYKEVLSANKEANVKILGVEDGINLDTILTRPEFEKLSEKEFERVYKPIEDLLNRNGNITLQQLTSIEFIGGGNRIPIIKEIFKKFVPQNKIGNHMNGDDSFAIGATFIAANLTAYNNGHGLIFNNKKTYLTEYGVNYDLKIKIYNPNSTSSYPYCDPNYKDLAVDCMRKINKEAKIFQARKSLNSQKFVTFKHDSDVMIDVNQYFDYTNETKQILKYKIKISEKVLPSIISEKGFNNVTPKVSLKFNSDKLGLITLKAELLYEVITYLKMTKDKKGKHQFSYSLDTVEPLNAGDLIDEISKLNANKNMTKTEKEKIIKRLRNEIGTNKTEVKRKDLEVYFENALPLPMSKSNIIKSRVKLNSFDTMDETRALNADKRNQLESVLFSKKEWIEEEDSKLYATESELNEFNVKLKETRNWYENEGNNSDADTVSARIELINKLFKKFDTRMELAKKRNFAVEYFTTEMIRISKESNDMLESKPWLKKEINEVFSKKIELLNKWFNEKIESQNLLKLYDTPIIVEDEIYSKLENIKSELGKLKRTAKPIEIKETEENEEI